jgi:hypothetical protein
LLKKAKTKSESKSGTKNKRIGKVEKRIKKADWQSQKTNGLWKNQK